MGDGPWLEFPDSDYYFGQGILRIAVMRRLATVMRDGARFVFVEGLEYCWTGAPMGVRRVYVRESALLNAGVTV